MFLSLLWERWESNPAQTNTYLSGCSIYLLSFPFWQGRGRLVHPCLVCAIADRHRFKPCRWLYNLKKRFILEVVLLNLLQHSEVCSSVFELPSMLAWLYPTLPSPSVHVGASEDAICLTLTDGIGVCLRLLQLVGYA